MAVVMSKRRITQSWPASGSLFSWGRNINGRLGHGHSQPVSVPEKVKALQGAFITKIACGWSHSLCYSGAPPFSPTTLKRCRLLTGVGCCSLCCTDRDGGRLWTWGVGKDGRLGQGDNSDRYGPACSCILHPIDAKRLVPTLDQRPRKCKRFGECCCPTSLEGAHGGVLVHSRAAGC
jgi:hypothetical protein